jgi:hypothetical protein
MWQIASSQNSMSYDSFAWLIGTWENMDQKAGESATERWTKDATQGLEGIGVSMRGQDTVFVERLKILEKEGQFYYVADVSHNAAPVYFTITEVTETGFVSENPEHDFPKMISYSYDGAILTATISAGKKKIPFRFRKAM